MGACREADVLRCWFLPNVITNFQSNDDCLEAHYTESFYDDPIRCFWRYCLAGIEHRL